MRETLNGILAKHTGQKLEKIGTDTERDFFMDSANRMQLWYHRFDCRKKKLG